MDIQKVKELALANGFKLKEQADGSMDLNAYVYDFANAIEQAAKAHEAEKLKGCVVVPESEYNEIAQYKGLYKRAIVNARKRKNQINWAHVAGLGVGSGRAVELCKELKIDPHATDMKAMLEAAQEQSHV